MGSLNVDISPSSPSSSCGPSAIVAFAISFGRDGKRWRSLEFVVGQFIPPPSLVLGLVVKGEMGSRLWSEWGVMPWCGGGRAVNEYTRQ